MAQWQAVRREKIFAAYQSSDGHILYTHDGFEDREVFEEYVEGILDMHSIDSVLKEGGGYGRQPHSDSVHLHRGQT